MHTIIQHARTLSDREFAVLAMDDLAFVKPQPENGTPGFAIYAADGTQIGWSERREVAFAAVVQHDMEPVSVH